MCVSPEPGDVREVLDALRFVALELGILVNMAETSNLPTAANFVHDVVVEHNATGAFGGRVQTRFPPEPNGYLHIGHAKAITADFELAREFNGVCRLRFDDTNPDTEDASFVAGIVEDLAWLGYPLDRDPLFTSDYFAQLAEWAELLISNGLAYVDDQDGDTISEQRGGYGKPGVESPFRNRTVDENLALFAGMRAGDFDEGARVLRARIDMQHENMQLRDPVMYRIRNESHHRTGDGWSVYPTYDWAHGQSDSIEGITHSVCTLEFEQHRPLYDWYIGQLEVHHPQQIEFAKLVISNTMMSKRKLTELVAGGFVEGWDDPRMPTISGFRRRGFTPESIRSFAKRVGITKHNSTTDIALMNLCIREHLNRIAPRVTGVLDPLKVVIENYPEDEFEMRMTGVNPEDENAGTREVPFGRELYIERSDFMEEAPKKFFRLTVGGEVRLRNAFFLKCNEVVKDEQGEIVELRCTYDPETSGGKAPDGRKVKGTIHWISAAHAIDAEVRLYDVMFENEDPSDVPEGKDWKDLINPNALVVMQNAKVEPLLNDANAGDSFQFVRNGYFCIDSKDSQPGKLVLNRTVTLKDAWSKQQKKGGSPK